jgi:haloalkane dehalogenase
MHYVDEGKGEPIACLHGEPTWGYLYRKFIPPLSITHRLIVPDHMGFGKSKTLQDREYTYLSHVQNLEALLNDELDVQDLTLVLQDWGGLIGGAYALRNPERVKRLFIMNTVLPMYESGTEERMAASFDSRWFRWVKSAIQDDSLSVVLGSLSVTVLSMMKLIGFENLAQVDDTWVAAYSAPFGTREECKGAIEFPIDIFTGRAKLFEVGDADAIAAIKQKPAMMAEGMRDQALPAGAAIAQFIECCICLRLRVGWVSCWHIPA